MDNNEYLDSLMRELANEGIVPPSNNNSNINNINDRELEIILQMQRATGKEYSEEQRKILEHHGNACILACAGSGKALVNGTKVLTINGYIPIEKLKVGDIVFNAIGGKEQVLGVYPQGKKKIYKVHFDKNRVIKCCGEHLWTVHDKQWEVKNTLEMKDMLDSKKYNTLKIPKAIFDQSEIYDSMFKYTLDELKEDIKKEKELQIKDIDNTSSINEFCYKLVYKAENLDKFYKDGVRVTSKKLIDTIKLYLELNKNICELQEKENETVIYSHKVLNDTINLIEETNEYEEMTCIKVSGSAELFLTEHCIVTHNTTVSTHLIAKRILTGEIRDVNKLIYTTYSKAGANEMKERIDKLLGQLGVKVNVQVRTLHSFFLQVLRTFGVTANIIEGSERSKMIRQACKDANFIPKDDDLMLIDNLLSYQVNCLLSDKKTIGSYVNTLENLMLEQYSKIRKSYASQKNQKGIIDYDDMQSFLYLWLVKYAKSDNQAERDIAKSVRDYCKAMYTDFYIDEAQDVSKIQFAIIRAMTCNPDNTSVLDRNLVFIGDDDQCLLDNTIIATENGDKFIKDIKVGDKVLSLNNGNIVKSTVMEMYEHGLNNNISLVKITTASGKSYTSTADHKVMVKIPDKFKSDVIEIEGNQYVISDNLRKVLEEYGKDKIINRVIRHLPIFGYILDLPHFGKDIKTNNGYTITSAASLSAGMIFSRMDGNTLIDDEITSVEIVNKRELIEEDRKVYCLNLASNNNYFANNLLTHNCIYQWRGGDPSIILSIGPTFDVPTFVLSTNYRCLNEIVDYAAMGVKCNNSRYTKGMNAFNAGGSVKIYQSTKEDLCNLSIMAMNHIKYWLNKGENLSDIAVLSRNNFHLAILSNMLLREGIYCNMTEDMKLTKSYMYQDVKNIIAVSEPSWKPDITSKVLWRLCRFMGASNSKVIADFQDNSGLSLEDTLGWIVKNFIDRNIDFSKKLNINLQSEQNMRYHLNKLSSETASDIKMVYSALTCGNREECIKTLLYQYLSASSFMYKSKDKNRSIVGLVVYICNLMKKDGVEKMLEFLRVTEQLEAGRMAIPGEKMTLTTIHSAKGREWKNVIMFACDNVSQPSFDGIYHMLEDGVSVHDVYENIDEERRLFYVGNTRAKENLFVITYNQPSIFILEALGAFKDKVNGNNDTILELVSNNDIQDRFNEIISEKLQDSNSKYYYNIDDYKIT